MVEALEQFLFAKFMSHCASFHKSNTRATLPPS